jgi:PAS domain S-box-containing protein
MSDRAEAPPPENAATSEVLWELARVVPLALVVLSRDRRFQYVNPAATELFGCEFDQLVGADMIEYLIPGERSDVMSYFRSILPAQPGRRDLEVLRPNGERRSVHFSHVGFEMAGEALLLGILDDVTEARRVSREAIALADSATRLAMTRTLEATLNGLAQSVVQATTAVACGLFLQAPDGGLKTAGTFGLKPGYAEAMEAAASLGAPRGAVKALHSRAAVIEEDLVQRRLADTRYGPVHDLIRDEPWTVGVYLPLLHRDKAVGALSAYYAVGKRPPETEMDFLRAMANEAALAVEYARLLETQRENVALEQRQRLARELHDSISQTVYGIVLAVKTAQDLIRVDATRAEEPLAVALRLSEAALAEMRALIFELRPEALDREGLIGALKHHTAAIRARHGLLVEETFGTEPRLSLDTKQGLYRIAQEALHNAARHARAKRVGIKLVGNGDEIRLQVWDDGVGFDPAGPYPGHLGLQTMRERASELGGHLEIASRLGGGTRVSATIPTTR